MAFEWEKRGLIFRPDSAHGWMNSHAQVPTVLPIEEEGVVRVYFATRPVQSLSQTTFVDLDMEKLDRVVRLHTAPILPLGEPGMFDEHGIMPSSVIRHDGLVYLYYSGWSRGGSLPYQNYTGLAVSEDGGVTFTRASRGPILDRTPSEVYSATSPHVHREGERWWMFYCAGTAWLEIQGKLEHTYDIKVARSADGVRWTQEGDVVIPQERKDEALTKPTLAKIGDRYHLWFCARGCRDFRGGTDSYRLGYATSGDLESWERDDSSAGLSPGVEGDWDHEMVAYPAFAEFGGERWMFYNGNGFGREGFGVARLRA